MDNESDLVVDGVINGYRLLPVISQEVVEGWDGGSEEEVVRGKG